MTDPKPVTALEIVQALYEAFGSGDEARLRELIAPDVDWRQCEGFPGGEHRRGIESVLAGVLRGNRSTWVGFRVDIERFVAADDEVVAIGSYEGVHCDTGKPMRAVFAHAYRVAGGRVTRFDQFVDTWPMVQAMRADESGPAVRT